ncbi:RcnB family protein [Sphingomonas sp. PR090111-T3T-6A]|uniref:RcnB family protein n=1 Tax=Sphingomonas sp. PR090111-T3T-6A TaxID=685778 RepID=UPI00036CF992|nr:RcnB family protein [Sphingomonas sp. PR090111-T3T-6A]
MRRIDILAGVAVWLGCVPAMASADVTATPAPPVGAPIGLSTEQGSWGQSGWQAGAAPVVASAAGTKIHSGKKVGAYKRPEPGATLPQIWLNPDYTISDWRGWGLAQPAQGTRWVRYYDDAVLIDDAAKVKDVRYAVDWKGGYHAAAYAASPARSVPFAVNSTPRVTTVQKDENTVVTTSVVDVAPTFSAPVAGYAAEGTGNAAYAADGMQVVGYTPGTITTVTTTHTIPGSKAKGR